MPIASSPIKAPAGGYVLDQQIEAMRQNFEGRVKAVEFQTGIGLQGLLAIPLLGAILAAGTPLAAFADSASSTPGVTVDALVAVGVRWNDAATQTAVWTEVDLPIDLDASYPVTATILMAKSGATAADVTSWDIVANAQTVGVLEDAGANLGGTTTALTSAQAALPAKTITRLTLPIYLPPSPPARLSISLKPTNGTLGTDDAICVGFWLEYVKKPGVARAQIDMRAAILAAGTPMAAFANNAGASAPGITLDNTHAVGIRWNNQGTLTAVWGSLPIPLDMDVTKPSVFVVLVDKSGATIGDTCTFDLGCYEAVPGALEDAGSNLGGTTSAIAAPTATAKTVAKLTLGIAPNTFTAGPGELSISLKPTDGTLGTDDAICVGFWLEYTRKSGGSPMIPVDLKAAVLAAGTPMAAWANNAGASAPGVTLDNAKAVAIRWNNFATQTAILSYVDLPLNVDTAQPITVNVLASKNGATAADATTFDVGLFEQVPGALEDANVGGLGLGGTTTALPGAAAAKTVSLVTYTIPGNTLTASPGRLSVSVKPTNGSNVTDDVVLNGLYFTFTAKTG